MNHTQKGKIIVFVLEGIRLFDWLSCWLVVPAIHVNTPRKLLKNQAKLNRYRLKLLTFYDTERKRA